MNCECNPDILPDPSAEGITTVAGYLQGISPLLTEKALQTVLVKRRLSASLPVCDVTERELDLAEAEVYWQLCNLPVGGATTKDVDGSWSHTEGGWNISKANLDLWYKKYVTLRELWGEKVLTRSKIRIINL